jgi:hypothetical protein
MKPLTTAALALGALFAVPAYASSDVSSDRHLAVESRRGATGAVPADASPAPAPAKHADCATECSCARAKPSTPGAADRLGGR